MGLANSFVLGQYVERHSLVHRLDPRTKLVSVFLFMMSAALLKDWASYAVAAVFVVGSARLSNIPPACLIKGLKPAWLIAAAAAFFHLLLTKGGRLLIEYGAFRVYEAGVITAIEVSAKIVLLLLAATLLTLTTKLGDLTCGMEVLLKPVRRLGVPTQEIAMMLALTIRFIPLLLTEAETIMKAQKARGANFASGPWLRRLQSYLAVVVPILLQSLQRAEQASVALEARGYRPGQPRTPLRTLSFATPDYGALAISALFALTQIVLRL